MPPVADDHVPPVAPPPTVPFKAAARSEQIVWLAPALAVAAGWIVTTMCDGTAGHGDSWPAEVSVSVTAPAEISAADGV